MAEEVEGMMMDDMKTEHVDCMMVVTVIEMVVVMVEMVVVMV